MKDFVIYKNEFNTVPLRNFKAVEMDLLFALMSQLKDRGENKLTLSFDELKTLSKYNKETAIDSFIADLEHTYEKLTRLNVRFETDDEIKLFVFFIDYTIKKFEQTITVGVHPEFKHLINEMTGEFTKFELEEITQLRSSYAKSAYRLFKQFRSTGVFSISIEEFRDLLDIPKSYEMFNIRQRVLEPILKELPQYFHGLRVQEIKGKGKRKRQIVQLIFTFEPQENFRTDKKGKVYLTKKDEDGSYYNEYPGDLKDLSPSDFKRIFKNKKPQQQVITENGYSEEDWDKDKQVD